jgi:hypothetical protein
MNSDNLQIGEKFFSQRYTPENHAGLDVTAQTKY